MWITVCERERVSSGHGPIVKWQDLGLNWKTQMHGVPRSHTHISQYNTENSDLPPKRNLLLKNDHETMPHTVRVKTSTTTIGFLQNAAATKYSSRKLIAQTCKHDKLGWHVNAQEHNQNWNIPTVYEKISLVIHPWPYQDSTRQTNSTLIGMIMALSFTDWSFNSGCHGDCVGTLCSQKTLLTVQSPSKSRW